MYSKEEYEKAAKAAAEAAKRAEEATQALAANEALLKKQKEEAAKLAEEATQALAANEALLKKQKEEIARLRLQLQIQPPTCNIWSVNLVAPSGVSCPSTVTSVNSDIIAGKWKCASITCNRFVFGLATEHFRSRSVTTESYKAAEDLYSWLLRIGHDEHGLFGIKKNLGEELRTAVMASRLQKTMLAPETVWFHQLKHENGRTDICMYAEDENKSALIPAAVIEVGLNKKYQIMSYCINLSTQLVSYNNVMLSLEVSLSSDQCPIKELVLRANFLPCIGEGAGYLWSVPVWQGEGSEENFARVLDAFMLCAAHNKNPQDDDTWSRLGPNCARHKTNDDVWKVYKCFGNSSVRKVDLNTKYLKGTVFEYTGLKYKVLEYSFIEGNHTPTNVTEVVQILQQLLTLHQDNCVHGDIRASNIVYGEFSSLIDFDLAGEENKTLYPQGFVWAINDGQRHDNAREGCVLLKHHDCFSFAWLMSTYECEEDRTRWKQATDKVKGNDVQAAIKILTHALSAQLTPNVPFQTSASGSPPLNRKSPRTIVKDGTDHKKRKTT